MIFGTHYAKIGKNETRSYSLWKETSLLIIKQTIQDLKISNPTCPSRLRRDMMSMPVLSGNPKTSHRKGNSS